MQKVNYLYSPILSFLMPTPHPPFLFSLQVVLKYVFNYRPFFCFLSSCTACYSDSDTPFLELAGLLFGLLSQQPHLKRHASTFTLELQKLHPPPPGTRDCLRFGLIPH